MSLTSMAMSRSTSTTSGATRSLDVQDDDPGGGSSSTEKFGELVEYIPTEMVTIFLAAMSSREALAQWAGVTSVGIYLTCLVATPVLFLLLFAGSVRQSGQKLFAAGTPIPWWPAVAGTAAFGAWGLVVPGVLAESHAALGPVVALFATILTILLPVLGRVAEKPTAT